MSELEQQLFTDGVRHELVLLEKLEKEGHRIARLPGKQNDADYTATHQAMAEGYDFIHQASLCHGGMRGSADLLRKIEQPSALGEWSYIPIECKLASKPKTTFLVQASAYCELLIPLLGSRPDQFDLYLGGGRFQRYNTDQFWAWYQHLRQRFSAFQERFDPSQAPEDSPGDHSNWTAFIEERLEQQRDLILVAGMRQSQRQKLRAKGITTIEELAALPGGSSVKGLSGEALHELRSLAASLRMDSIDGCELDESLAKRYKISTERFDAFSLAIAIADQATDTSQYRNLLRKFQRWEREGDAKAEALLASEVAT